MVLFTLGRPYTFRAMLMQMLRLTNNELLPAERQAIQQLVSFGVFGFSERIMILAIPIYGSMELGSGS